jgi:hypothetical protein
MIAVGELVPLDGRDCGDQRWIVSGRKDVVQGAGQEQDRMVTESLRCGFRRRKAFPLGFQLRAADAIQHSGPFIEDRLCKGRPGARYQRAQGDHGFESPIDGACHKCQVAAGAVPEERKKLRVHTWLLHQPVRDREQIVVPARERKVPFRAPRAAIVEVGAVPTGFAEGVGDVQVLLDPRQSVQK